MLGGKQRKELEASLNRANQECQTLAKQTTAQAEALHRQRHIAATETIQSVENYINQLSNSPKEFDKSISEFKVEVSRFDHIIEEYKVQIDSAHKKAASGAASGVALGGAVVGLGPTAALAVAATFGTASTGTAIGALSGAAATSASLAWLGGGALSVGGAGVAGGKFLLALAGPVGWTIAGVATVGSGAYLYQKNKTFVADVKKTILEIHARSQALKIAKKEASSLTALTKKHVEGVESQLSKLTLGVPKNYLEFSTSQKQDLAALINNIRSLSQLLNKKIA